MRFKTPVYCDCICNKKGWWKLKCMVENEGCNIYVGQHPDYKGMKLDDGKTDQKNADR